METILLNGTLREKVGKEANRKLRASGQMPAVLYGAGIEESISVSLEPRQLNKALENPKKTNALMNVDLGSDAGTHTVLVREIQRHPVRRTILHVDLVAPDLSKPVVSVVPLRYTGKSIGVSMGGRLRTPYREVSVECLPADIPAEIVVDITDLDIGQAVHATSLDVGEGVSVIYDRDFVVVKVLKPRGGMAVAETEEAADEE
ncbi:MAG: 50S ribosomal protein L25 [Bradymonadia bacterium]